MTKKSNLFCLLFFFLIYNQFINLIKKLKYYKKKFNELNKIVINVIIKLNKHEIQLITHII